MKEKTNLGRFAPKIMELKARSKIHLYSSNSKSTKGEYTIFRENNQVYTSLTPVWYSKSCMRDDYIVPIRPVQFKVRKRGNAWAVRLGTVVLLLCTGLVSTRIFAKSPADLISPLGVSFNAQEQQSTLGVSKSLEEVVNKSLEGTTGTYSLVIKNLKTGEYYTRDEDRLYQPASLYKLWVMGEVYQQIKEGKFKEDDIINESVVGLNATFKISPEYAEQTSGGVNYSVDEAIHQMITISHNYAALALAKRVKLSEVRNFLAENGLKSSIVGVGNDDPVTNAKDIALFFEKLYLKELVDGEYSDKMLEKLKQQKKNNKLPKYIAHDVEIAHKTGELGWFTHDAGIVYTPKADYLIVVMSESPAPGRAEDRIAQISKAVYDYFQFKK